MHATDLDPSVIDKAKLGRYSSESVDDVPKAALEKYFEVEHGQYVVSDEIKQRVIFRRHNLLSDPYDNGYDLMACRNVLIYFQDEAKERLFTKFHQSLKQGGYLFVGATEQIMHPEKFGFSMVGTFFYKKV